MVSFLKLALAVALAAQSDAQFLGMSPKAMLGLVKVLPAALLSPAMTEMFNKQINGAYGKISERSSAVPRRQMVTPLQPALAPGTKSVKIRYGPYTVPSMMKKNGLDEGGALWNYPDKSVDKPCETCIVTGIRAGLEYADGANANIDSGAWLHHFVLFNAGPGRVDATCASSDKSLPHLNVGTTPTSSERMFASGNERIPLVLNMGADGSKASKLVGYHLNSADKFAMIVDLMNESNADKTVYLTITYDFVDGHPAGWDDVRPIWFDIDQCGFSEVAPTQQSGKFTISAKPWVSTVDGEILGWFGHLHDGGVSVTMEVDGKPECVSTATYGGDKAFVEPASMVGMKDSATTHISNMSVCAGKGGVKTVMKKGQVWNLKADYDFGKYKGMKSDDGTQSDIMGISFMYLRQPRK